LQFPVPGPKFSAAAFRSTQHEFPAAARAACLKIKRKNPARPLLGLKKRGGEAMSNQASLVPIEAIERWILYIRGQKVMMDEDLAALYGVPSKTLVQAVKRNIERFPGDFMFQLTDQEVRELRSQIVTSIELTHRNNTTKSYKPDIVDKSGWLRGKGGRRYNPFAFTEQGVAMLSSVLRSPRAVRVNIEIMRAFVKLRRLVQSHAELAGKLAALEKRYDSQFRIVFDAIRELMSPPPNASRKKIGFDI
jgi:hypothetical protein